MVKQNSVNLIVDINATGYKIAGGSSTARGFTLAGAADFTLTSQASTGNLTLPDNAATTLLAGSDFAAKGDILSASAANTLSVLTVGSDGQVLEADSGQASGLRWASSSSLEWVEVTGTTQAMVVNEGYIANNVALVTLTLPVTAALGSVFRVAGKGAGLWRIAQNASQVIHFGNLSTTVGVAGTLDAVDVSDCIHFVCITADTDFVVLSSVGNIDVV